MFTQTKDKSCVPLFYVALLTSRYTVSRMYVLSIFKLKLSKLLSIHDNLIKKHRGNLKYIRGDLGWLMHYSGRSVTIIWCVSLAGSVDHDF